MLRGLAHSTAAQGTSLGINPGVLWRLDEMVRGMYPNGAWHLINAFVVILSSLFP